MKVGAVHLSTAQVLCLFYFWRFEVDRVELKVLPAGIPANVPATTTPAPSWPTRGARYRLAGALLLRQQEQTARLYRERLFSVTETRLALGLTASTVRRWLSAGLVKGVRTGRQGHWRIPVSEILRLRGER
jgi:Helix-turn-helix domain